MYNPPATYTRVLAVSITLAWMSSILAGEIDRRWPFSLPERSRLPVVQQADWARNPIDTFVLASLEEQGLTPASVASRRVLVRRLYFDLIGLPPSPEVIQAFVSNPDPAAFEQLVEELLGDPRYGERWARRWLDLARYADTAGYEGDPDLPHAWRYRDYVIVAMNDDKPYDLFIKEQLAGDEFEQIMGAGDLPSTPPERLVAMTFLRLAPFTEPRGDETRHELLSEMTSTVGSVFLGLTVGCAKCHDHKYDEIPTADFYRMKAFFATVQLQRPEPGDAFQIGGALAADFYRYREAEWAASKRETLVHEQAQSQRELDELASELRERLGDDYKSVINDPADERITRAERQQYHNLVSQDRFTKQQTKRLQPVAMSLRHSYGPPYEPGIPVSRVMIRGEYDNPGEIVEPGFLRCITGDAEPARIPLDPFKRWPTRGRRLVLADWIANRDNPLTARVMVNRLWHWHFGRGIVPTPSDLGVLSDGPSHQELLDWLAVEFIESGWSIKHVHRLICNSASYRQVSDRIYEQGTEVDPHNRLLWRFNRRRLDAEMIRDAILSVSGRLTAESHGLPIFPPLPDGIEEDVKYSESKWNTQFGAEGRKRSIYIYQQRTLSMPFMQTFDALVCDESRPRRSSSVTPLQALAMFNGAFANTEASQFADRVRNGSNASRHRQIDTAFNMALGRSPTEEETVRLAEFMSAADDAPLLSLCRVLLNSNEFVYID